MTDAVSALAGLGWSAFFQSQLDLTEIDTSLPVRVLAVHRNALEVDGGDGPERLVMTGNALDLEVTVGDWLIAGRDTRRPLRVLERRSVFQRRAAGTGRAVQLIAANVDTLFIVSSCNRDFNVPRLERYLALAKEAGVTPVVVLTKADQCETPQDFRRRAETILPGLLAETVDARDPSALSGLALWCGPGQTVALVGSSGVGKSTLVNTLTDGTDLRTAAARAGDDRGRHTTTGRMLHRLSAGGWLLDTPGMRELQLFDMDSGIEAVFEDILTLAALCRFKDCKHDTEPGCAVQAAIEAGTLEPERLSRYRKLASEERRNSQSLAERRAQQKSFGKMCKTVLRTKRAHRGEF